MKGLRGSSHNAQVHKKHLKITFQKNDIIP